MKKSVGKHSITPFSKYTMTLGKRYMYVIMTIIIPVSCIFSDELQMCDPGHLPQFSHKLNRYLYILYIKLLSTKLFTMYIIRNLIELMLTLKLWKISMDFEGGVNTQTCMLILNDWRMRKRSAGSPTEL